MNRMLGLMAGLFLLVAPLGSRAEQVSSGESAVPGSNRADASTRFSVSFLDAVDLYQKDGLVEVYGAVLRQQKAGPIRITSSRLMLEQNFAWLTWAPDRARGRPAETLDVEFVSEKDVPKSVDVIVTLKSGKAYLFRIGSPPKVEVESLPVSFPDELKAYLNLKPAGVLSRNGKVLTASLPSELRSRLEKHEIVSRWTLRVYAAPGAEIAIARLGFVERQDQASAVTVSGKIEGAAIRPGTSVTLRTESGATYRQELSPKGTFSFSELNRGQLVSIRYRHEEQEYFSDRGRWFALESGDNDVVVTPRPIFVNEDGRKGGVEKAKFNYDNGLGPYGAFYLKHTRQYWPGGGGIQEFDSTTFTNNYGFIDKDRFETNGDQCFRIASFGSSFGEAIQVRPFEKYNIILEEELGYRLGRCVEVLSFGRNNGDVGAFNDQLAKVAIRFKPNLVLFEVVGAGIMQLQPELLKRAYGWDHAHNALANFYFEDKGKLKFREMDIQYVMHMTKPDYSELIPGVPFFNTMFMPFGDLPPLAQDALRYFLAITDYYRKHYPGLKIIYHTGGDESRCRGACNGSVTLPSGKTINTGPLVFAEEFERLCSSRGLMCIRPHLSERYGTPTTLLSFQSDSHFSPRGHQWLASELTEGICKYLKNKGDGVHCHQ